MGNLPFQDNDILYFSTNCASSSSSSSNNGTVCENLHEKIKSLQWLDKPYLQPQSIFERLTYRAILERLFDDSHTIYHTLEQRRGDYIDNNITTTKFRPLYIGTVLTFMDRTTYLLAMVQEMKSNLYLRIIFKVFLRYAENINFFHPNIQNNLLKSLCLLMETGEYSDICTLVLQRKEIHDPEIIDYLKSCIKEEQHFKYILDTIHVDHNALFSNLFYKYIHNNEKLSRQIMQKFLLRIKLPYTTMKTLFLSCDFISPVARNLLQFIPIVDWRNLEGYNEQDFKQRLLYMCQFDFLLTHNSHELLAIYKTIFCSYQFKLTLNNNKIQKLILLRNYTPEQLIFLEITLHLEPYKNILRSYNTATTTGIFIATISTATTTTITTGILDQEAANNVTVDECPSFRYIQNRYKKRYRKFITYWRHKTYCPGSKIFTHLIRKYDRIMQKQFQPMDYTYMDIDNDDDDDDLKDYNNTDKTIGPLINIKYLDEILNK